MKNKHKENAYLEDKNATNDLITQNHRWYHLSSPKEQRAKLVCHYHSLQQLYN